MVKIGKPKRRIRVEPLPEGPLEEPAPRRQEPAPRRRREAEPKRREKVPA